MLMLSLGKTKRKKKDDSDEMVTYINERNKVFNKKVSSSFLGRDACVETEMLTCRSLDTSTSTPKSTSLSYSPYGQALTSRIRENFERGTAL
jgi:hypothetical protein